MKESGFDRDTHQDQIDRIHEAIFDLDAEDWRDPCPLPAIDWARAPELLVCNGYRPLGIVDYTRANESVVPMWVWRRECSSCSKPLFALTLPWEFSCRWLHFHKCRDCWEEGKDSPKAVKRAQRFEQMRTQARSNRAKDPARQQAVIDAMRHFESIGRRVSRAPNSPDYFVRRALSMRLINMAPKTARDVMEALIRSGKIVESESKYMGSGKVQHSLKLPEAS